ncbi:uncharacterized protein F4822DRAFT_89609 [Hypoxylon trugodes]|uniref:uncharacterized protein n=1 Tax=Hypoxylon trugodes TaxID=326681 RepID=UPI0021971AAF|nr:uncharacterized protein F4822DRAFT_89609 [Hypoxylon trugodes]KAI1383014.1 hypothetical protein F4822DRAFT_89609 [Hypoxylon trugodes]
MNSIGAWLRGSGSKSNSASTSQADLQAQEIAALEDALIGTAMIMNDDIEGAEERLRKGDSSFHHLGMCVCVFMRSILGFEKSIMAEAVTRLTDCENNAWNEMKKAQKEGRSASEAEDRVYPPGSEYSLVMADSQLMFAVVSVLHESLTEAIKGAYKLRKAFITLDEIMQSEAAYLKRKGLRSDFSKENISSSSSSTSGQRGNGSDDTDTDLDFVDADEAHSGAQTPLNYEGHLIKDSNSPEKRMSQLSLKSDSTLPQPADKPSALANSSSQIGLESSPDSDVFKNPVDAFVHSGVSMCFGALLLILSTIPPTFSRLLSIIGFRGDRERGVRMLWQSSRFDNINGAVAGFMLLNYYNGLLGIADILPSEEDAKRGAVLAYPRAKFKELLSRMRARYPDSKLWVFEEAQVLGYNKDLRGAIEILKNNKDSKMRQVAALNNFEMALDSMYIHDYPAMRDNFIRCVELNDWSHSLYYYIAGCAELELYRDAFHSDEKNESEIQLHKKKANELFRKAPTVAGKKRFLARPLPFEQFVTRKLQKWEDRAKELDTDLVDIIGVSPAAEMTYLWNGTKKMLAPELQKSEKILSWGRLTASEEVQKKIKTEIDEQATRDVCRAAVSRSLGRLGEARELLDNVLAMDKMAFKRANRDDYALPAAHYEMAVLAWWEVQKPELRETTEKGDDDDWLREKTEECQSWLDKVAKWEAFVLDARISMRVLAGMDTLRWYKREHGWTVA